jgi:ABC-type transport system involved in cytochrome bd biosynthesis fused ATPase/permease subunit
MIVSSLLIPYTNINFTTKLTVDIKFAINCLILNVIFEIVGSYLNLIVSRDKKDFVLTIQEQFIKLVCGRVYGMNWSKLRELNKNELPDKISRAIFAVENCINTLITNIMDSFSLIGSVIILVTISPVSLFVITILNIIVYFYIIKKENEKLLTKRNDMHKKNEQFWNRYWTTLRNSNDYIIHHQKDKIIDVIKQSRYDIEKDWMDYDYESNKLVFKSSMVNQIIVLICIMIYIHNNVFSVSNLWNNFDVDIGLLNKETILLILTLYIYLTRLTEKFDDLLKMYTFFTKWEKDYDRIKIVLDESDERIIAHQMSLENTLEFRDIDFTYKVLDNRKSVKIATSGVFQFCKGETVLVRGMSGAGKSTLYDIINGSIPSSEMSSCSVHVDGKKCPDFFHNIEQIRTMVLQDSSISFDHSCYEIITDISDDNLEGGTIITFNENERVPDSVVWYLLQLVKLDDLFRDQFNNDIHMRLKDKISGGQKTRLMLARALFRASEYGRKSSILILDEPDKGLPADMTIEIIQNIIRWFKNKGILFLTLHTKEAQEINFDHIIEANNGMIKLIN